MLQLNTETSSSESKLTQRGLEMELSELLKESEKTEFVGRKPERQQLSQMVLTHGD